MKNKHLAAILCVALILAASMFGLMDVSPQVEAAPLFAPTPVSQARSVNVPQVATFFAVESITADQRAGCTNSADFEKADIQYVIDQGTVNTVTLKLQFTNDPHGSGATYIDGVNIVANNAADASSMQQFQVFGAWTCIYADVANSNPLSLTVRAVLK